MNDFFSSRSTTLRIVGIYALVGLLWIYTSDTVLGWFFQDPKSMMHIAIFKGSLYVIITSLLLYFLISRYARALKANDIYLRTILETEPECVKMLDADCNLLIMNRSGLNMIEADSLEQVKGQSMCSLVCEPYRDDFIALTKQVFQGTPSILEFEVTGLKGRHIWLETHAVPFRDEHGDIVALLGITRDVTERKKTDSALKDAAVKYRIVADNAYNWEFWSSPEGRYIYNSPSCRRVSGRPTEEFDDDPSLIWKIVHPDDRHLLLEHRHDINQAKALGEVEFRMIHPDGEIRWIHHVCQPVFDDQGIYLGTRGSFSDITKRRQAEERNLHLAAIVESSDDAIVGKTIEGLITSWNRGAERIFLYEESEVLGQPISMLIPPGYMPEVLKMHDKIRRGEHIEHFETVRRRKDGELINLSLSYSPIKDPQGRVVALSTIGRDITERKKAAAALLDNARIKRELEIAKEIQQSFLPARPLDLEGILMTSRCIPAAQVGGDYYDFFSLEEGKMDAVIADVTGHSVGSALLMIMTRSVLRAKVSAGRGPGKLLATMNDLLYDDLYRAELQISMFYVRLDRKNGLLTYANAGHNPPFLFSAGEEKFFELDAEGLIMGVMAGVRFEEKSVSVKEGDILILYTDGITEAECADGEGFGVERLREIVSAHREEHPNEIMEAIFRELARFTGSRPLSDDVALIVFKIV